MPTKSSAYQEGVGGPQSNWVSFFEGLLAREGEKDRLIVLLEASSTMAASFSIWWPSLLHAVRNRRQTPSSGGTGRRRSQPSSAALTKPTTIVISCAPSLLTTHTVQDPVDAADKSTGVTASGFGPGKRQIGDAEEVPLWWSAAEDGDATRTVLERRRLAALKSGNLRCVRLLHLSLIEVLLVFFPLFRIRPIRTAKRLIPYLPHFPHTCDQPSQVRSIL